MKKSVKKYIHKVLLNTIFHEFFIVSFATAVAGVVALKIDTFTKRQIKLCNHNDKNDNYDISTCRIIKLPYYNTSVTFLAMFVSMYVAFIVTYFLFGYKGSQVN